MEKMKEREREGEEERNSKSKRTMKIVIFSHHGIAKGQSHLAPTVR